MHHHIGARLRDHPAVIDDEAHTQLLSQLRSRLAALAAVHGAEFRVRNDPGGWYWPGTTLVLEPRAPGATQVVVFPEDAHTTWVGFGRSARVELAIQPDDLPRAVDEVMAVVGAIAAGQARQRLWFRRGGAEPVGLEG